MSTQAAQPNRTEAIERYVRAKKKDVGAAFVLALLLGPIGALYGSPLGGLILILLTIALAVSGLGVLAGVLGWLFALVLGPAAASDHNTRIRAEAELMAGGAL